MSGRREMSAIASAIANRDRLLADLDRRATRRRKLDQHSVVDGDVVRVSLFDGSEALVDLADWPTLGSYRFAISSGRVTVRRYGSKRGCPLGRLLLGVADDQYVDHINGNTLDNRRANLRVCVPQQNCWNQALSTKNTTGFKGVSRAKSGYRAYGYLNGKQRHLGIFSSSEDAARAYDAFARANFGEFACVNFAVEGEQSTHRGETL